MEVMGGLLTSYDSTCILNIRYKKIWMLPIHLVSYVIFCYLRFGRW